MNNLTDEEKAWRNVVVEDFKTQRDISKSLFIVLGILYLVVVLLTYKVFFT